MDEERLNEIEERAESARAGDRLFCLDEKNLRLVWYGDGDLCCLVGFPWGVEGQLDPSVQASNLAELFAHARPDVLDLCAEVRRLKGENDALKVELSGALDELDEAGVL